MEENIPYGYVDRLFRLNHNVSIITTTVEDREDVTHHHISRFLSPTSDSKNKTKVFGFDIEWNIEHERNSNSSSHEIAGAAVQLCDGDSCLIIQLSWNSTVPQSLVNFLRLPNYTFVGFGIRDNVAKLEKKYGFGCRNAVELGPLAANVMKRPRLSYCGVDELLFIVNLLDFRKDRALKIGSDWWKEYGDLSKEQAKLATINVYSYHMIGAKLLSQDWCK